MSEQHYPETDPNMNELQEGNRSKYSIYMIGGRKGGTGKSHNCRTLGEYFKMRNWMEQVILFNCDPTFDDVSHVYQESKKLIFSDRRFSQEKPVEIFESAANKNVVVNLPANIERQFDNWILNSGLLKDEMNEYYNKVYYFFVSDGCYRSIKSFVDHVDLYKNVPMMQNLLILNIGRLTSEEDFGFLNGKNYLIDALKDNQVPVLLCPQIAAGFQYLCDENELNYSEAVELYDNFAQKHFLAAFLDDIKEYYNLIFQDTPNYLNLKDLLNRQKPYLENHLIPDPNNQEALEIAKKLAA